MKNLVIGDLHFGIKTNSISWMESQIKFIKDQIIPVAIDNNVDNVVFLGDLFDIRYSVNQVIGISVKNVIRELAEKLYNKKIIFIAGNHDYYSPLEDSKEYNIYELIFGKEFIDKYTNIVVVNDEPYSTANDLYLPWYYTEDYSKLIETYNKYDNINTIYCHSDLSMWPDELLDKLNYPTVYAGHIHYISIDKERKLYNLGAALPLTFGDSNSQRYIYIIEDGVIISKIENTTTPNFKRFYNDEIFSINDQDLKNSFVQLCISDVNINKASYIEQLKYIKTTYTDSNIKVNVISNDILENSQNNNLITNIDSYISANIPDYLQSKYELIKTKINESKNK